MPKEESIKTQIKDLVAENKALKKENEDLKKQIDSYNNFIKAVQTKCDTMEKDLNNLMRIYSNKTEFIKSVVQVNTKAILMALKEDN